MPLEWWGAADANPRRAWDANRPYQYNTLITGRFRNYAIYSLGPAGYPEEKVAGETVASASISRHRRRILGALLYLLEALRQKVDFVGIGHLTGRQQTPEQDGGAFQFTHVF